MENSMNGPGGHRQNLPGPGVVGATPGGYGYNYGGSASGLGPYSHHPAYGTNLPGPGVVGENYLIVPNGFTLTKTHLGQNQVAVNIENSKNVQIFNIQGVSDGGTVNFGTSEEQVRKIVRYVLEDQGNIMEEKFQTIDAKFKEQGGEIKELQKKQSAMEAELHKLKTEMRELLDDRRNTRSPTLNRLALATEETVALGTSQENSHSDSSDKEPSDSSGKENVDPSSTRDELLMQMQDKTEVEGGLLSVPTNMGKPVLSLPARRNPSSSQPKQQQQQEDKEVNSKVINSPMKTRSKAKSRKC